MVCIKITEIAKKIITTKLKAKIITIKNDNLHNNANNNTNNNKITKII